MTRRCRAARARARSTRCWPRTTRLAGAAPRARRPLHPPRAGRRPAAHAGRSCRPGATCTASIPSASPAPSRCTDGARQAAAAARRAMRPTATACPRPSRIVLWGTDNLKTEGGPIAQALALMGARPRFDSYGRLAGAELIPLDELGRPRIDVVMTLSGIFRDLLPLQTKLLAEAALLAASADEPVEQNFVRKHALAYQARARLRPGDGRAARLQQRRRRLRLQRQPCWSRTAAGTTRTNWPRPTSRRKGFAYGRQRPAGAAGRAAATACWPTSSSPTRTSIRSSSASPPSTTTSTRSAASAARCSAPRAAGGAGLHRRPDARRRHGAHAVASRSRWRPAPACSTRSGTRACSSTATKACARSRRTSPTRWAGRRPPGRSRPGSTSS